MMMMTDYFNNPFLICGKNLGNLVVDDDGYEQTKNDA